MPSVRSSVICWACICVLLAPGCGLAAPLVPCGLSSVGSDVAQRFFHRAGALADGRVLVSGGMSLSIIPPTLVSLRDLSFFDPQARTFSRSFLPDGGGAAVSPRLITARSSHTQTTLRDGRVLIAGGYTAASGTSVGTAVASCELFDPATGAIVAGPDMSAPRAEHTATLLADGRVVVAGGGDSAQVFDPASDAWGTAFALAYRRLSHAAVLLPDFAGPGGDRVLLIGGGPHGGATLEMIDPAAGTSTAMTAQLGIAVDDVAAARLPDGTVLIVGGQDLATGDTIGDTYVYDPTADHLAPVPPPPDRAAGISDHQIAVFDHYAAVFGGEQQVSGQDTELDYAAVYDAAVGDWVCQFAMKHPHDDFAAAWLPGGDLLLIGGGTPFLGNELPSSNAETFSPVLTRLGDVNADERVDDQDIPAMLDALLNPGGAAPRTACAADCNRDGVPDGADISTFVNILLQSPPP